MTETTEKSETASASRTTQSPNWMLIIICLITAATAIWEAVAVKTTAPPDVWGYLFTGAGMVLFALQNYVWPRNGALADRLHLPAVVLTLIGVVLLVLSNTTGRRI